MADAAYRIAPIFLIRMAGVPFEILEKLATVETAQAARALIVRRAQFAKTKSDVERILASRKHNLSKELFRAWRKAIRSGIMPAKADPPSSAFATCWECASNLSLAEAHLQESLQIELTIARQALMDSARTFLPPYLVFAAGGVPELLDELLSLHEAERGSLPARNKRMRAKERHLLLYLQRVCAKNDTLSEYGPASWGTLDGKAGLQFTPQPGIAARETFLERWTAHGAAAALNADPDVRLELSPRLNPAGRIEGDKFLLTDMDDAVALDSSSLETLAACNGKKPAHSLGVEVEVLEKLARQNVLRWEMEVPALEPHAFDVLVDDVCRWRDGPVRRRWLELLQPLAALPGRFAKTTEIGSRLTIVSEARARLEELGARRTSDRFLYSAANPIGEECFRDCAFSISETLLNEVAIDAAPWIDLWRDCYAFIAGRVAGGLRQLFEQAAAKNKALPLPAFLRHCAILKVPLTGPGLVALAHVAFQEVKAAFRETFAARASTPECELSMQDCHFVRQNFDYERFDEYTYPSADLQIAARSAKAVRRGEYQWILAELHPPVALFHHGFYWSCPDKAALSRALTKTVLGRPNFHFGIAAADFTATTAVRFFDVMPELTYFVAPERAKPDWPVIQPAETEVFVDQQNGDVCLRQRGSGEYLGSFARAWVIPLGFHPFSFSLGAHTPRLRCGKVIVQRRSWIVTEEELGDGDFTGVSGDLVAALEELRARRGLPRYVYIRPTEQALRRSGAEGRDKDTKPVFVDLESYLFIEIFHRWLTKAGELEVTEMLPDPDHLLWQEKDGRRSFELRTQIVPR